MRYALTALALLLLLGACAPTTTRYDPAEGARLFTLSVDGTAVPTSGSTFTYKTDAFDIDIALSPTRFRLDLVNNGSATMRLIPDRSAIVLADGSSSNVVTGTVSWATRNDPQSTIVIPQGAKASEVLFPRANLYFADRLGVSDMFSWPLTARVTLRLVLALEIDGEEQEVTLLFVGTPEQQNP